MALYQKSVLNKYLKTLDEKKVSAAYQKFTAYFHNPSIQENIRNAKEEQYQEGFLRELFVKILGYTLNPEPDFNLTTEFKNIKNSKKADGAILSDEKAIAVIELKGTNTVNLDKVEQQAFDYLSNQPNAIYVITSNFEKLRFYIEKKTEHVEFNLFTLKEEEFKLLYLCLHKDHILSDLPQKIKKDSAFQEEDITKKLYKDYSAFKKALFNDMVMNNPAVPKLDLFKKSQKLIDRFLFIFFAEDKGLLPPNSITKIVKTFDALENLDSYKPLYEVFQQYFGYINSGRSAKGERAEIFAYNGGLFAADEMLDNLKVTDNILMNHTLVLSKYDFESEVDVNILGHIFEHSLNKIDEMTAEIEGQVIEKNKTKRKKDGVFYTPKYITKYIVDNTIGKLCEAQKETLGLKEEEYRPKRNKATKKRLLEDLEAYRSYLLSLTICDPACGSGAFLNQALDFLIKEHRYIDELQTKLLGGSIVLSDITNDILEKNIYGVDINEEAVDIARLSMWLRTAQKERTLTTLSDNIKCGNSLIDDPEVAGDKAFVWEEEFPEVFENGGFDVVIGNPPYVRQELIKPFKPYLKKQYKTFQGTADLFTYFIEISVDRLLNKKGLYSIIVANKWMRANYGKPLREWMKQKRIIEIIDFGDLPVFSDATAYPCILTLSPKQSMLTFLATEPATLSFGDLELYVKNNQFKVKNKSLAESGWALVKEEVSDLINKLQTNGIPLKKYVNNKIYRGVLTGLNEVFVIDKETKDKLILEDSKSMDIIKPFLAGRDVKRYNIDFEERYLIFARRGINIDSYPSIKKYLEPFQERLKPKPKEWKGTWKGRKGGNYKWYEIQDSIDYYKEFEKPKIILASISKNAPFHLDKENFYSNDKTSIIGIHDYNLLAILNSKLIDFFIHSIASTKANGYYEYKPMYISQIPVSKSIGNFNAKGKVVLMNKSEVQRKSIIDKFIRSLTRRLNLETISRNLQNWQTLTFTEFTKELKKQKIKLSLSQEEEWEEHFLEKKEAAEAIQAVIDKTDKEIDRMVYDLYGLTEEEIGIVESS